MKFNRSNGRRSSKNELAVLYEHDTTSVHRPYIEYCTSVPAPNEQTSGRPDMLHLPIKEFPDLVFMYPFLSKDLTGHMNHVLKKQKILNLKGKIRGFLLENGKRRRNHFRYFRVVECHVRHLHLCADLAHVSPGHKLAVKE